MGLTGKRCQQTGQHDAQDVAGPLRAQRAHPARRPAAYRFDDVVGIAVAHGGERGHRGRGRIAGAAEVQRRRRAVFVRVGDAFEHLQVAGLHPRHVAQQHGGEAGGVGVAHEPGEAFHLVALLGQQVGLPVGHHLQPVLDAAQEAVGGAELAPGAARQVAGAGEQAQCVQGTRRAQRRVAAAPDQLQGLRHELDLANTTLAELDVMAGDAGNPVLSGAKSGALVGVDAPLHGVNVGEGGEVEVAAPDKGADGLEEAGAEGKVASHRARLQHGRAFPILSHALIVGDGPRQGDAGRCGRRVGAQPQVGAEHVAVGVVCLHQGHEVTRHASVEGAGGVAVVNTRVRIVQQDEVDIAGIVQFARAELAHAKDGETARLFRLLGVGQAQLAAVVGGAQQVRDRGAQSRLGEVGQRLGDADEVPGAADIGDGGDQGDDAFGGAQRARQPGARRRRGVAGGDRRHGPLYRRLGPGLHAQAQRRRLAHDEVGQVGAVAAQAAQHGTGGPIAGEPRLGASERGEAFHQPLGGGGIGGSRPVRRQTEPGCGRRHGHAAAGWS